MFSEWSHFGGLYLSLLYTQMGAFVRAWCAIQTPKFQEACGDRRVLKRPRKWLNCVERDKSADFEFLGVLEMQCSIFIQAWNEITISFLSWTTHPANELRFARLHSLDGAGKLIRGGSNRNCSTPKIEIIAPAHLTLAPRIPYPWVVLLSGLTLEPCVHIPEYA
jgi:hypothetical protein